MVFRFSRCNRYRSSHVHARWHDDGLCRVEHAALDRWEHLPEAQGLVSAFTREAASSGTSDYILTARAHREVQNTLVVTCEGLNFLHGWVFPKDDLIQ